MEIMPYCNLLTSSHLLLSQSKPLKQTRFYSIFLYLYVILFVVVNFNNEMHIFRLAIDFPSGFFRMKIEHAIVELQFILCKNSGLAHCLRSLVLVTEIKSKRSQHVISMHRKTANTHTNYILFVDDKLEKTAR